MTTPLLNRPPGAHAHVAPAPAAVTPAPAPAAPPAPLPASAPRRSLNDRMARPYELKRTTGRIAWFIAVAMVGLAVAGFVTGKPFSLGTGDNTLEFPGEAAATTVVVEGGGAPVVTQAPAEPAPVVAAAPLDLTGTWTGNGGVRYRFVQNGSFVTFDELDAFGGITASASGQLLGDTVDFTYENVFFTGGTGFLDVIGDDGDALSGQITDLFTGVTTPLVLTR